MKNKLIVFNTAVLAKDKGFDIKCYNAFDFKIYQPSNLFEENLEEISNAENYSNSEYKRYWRPTQSLLQRWLREVHKIKLTVWDYYEEGYYFAINGNTNKNKQKLFNTYEKALEAGLVEALNLIK